MRFLLLLVIVAGLWAEDLEAEFIGFHFIGQNADGTVAYQVAVAMINKGQLAMNMTAILDVVGDDRKPFKAFDVLSYDVPPGKVKVAYQTVIISNEKFINKFSVAKVSGAAVVVP